MTLKGHRLIWKDPPEAAPTQAEAASESGSDPEQDEDEKTNPQEDAEKKAKAEKESQEEQTESSRKAEELAQKAEEENGTDAESPTPTQSNSAYELLKQAVGESWAKIIAFISSTLLGLKIFGDKVKSKEQKEAEELVDKTKKEYSAVIKKLIDTNKISDKVVLRDGDPALLAEDHGIKTPAELETFFSDKTPLQITSETSIVDYVEMAKKQSSPATPTTPANPTTEPTAGPTTSTESEDQSKFEKAPTAEVDLSAPGSCGRFKLKTGEELRITKYNMFVGGKKFKVEVKKIAWLDLEFNKITPSGEGYNINLGAVGTKKDIQLDENKITTLINGLYQKKESSEFTQSVTGPEGENFEFKFTAVA